MSGRWWLIAALGGAACSSNLNADDTGVIDTADDTGDTANEDSDTGDSSGDTDTGANDTDTGANDTDDSGIDSGPTCADDAREDDDVVGDATAVAATSHTTGQVCEGDSDWFSVPVGRGCLVDVNLDFAVATGDLDMILYDAEGSVVALGWEETDDENLAYIHGAAASTLYVEVYGYEDAEAPYTLNVTTACEPDPGCDFDDLFEANNTSSTAFPLNAVHTDVVGVLCTDDLDWYEVPFVPYGCHVAVALDFEAEFTDLDLRIYDSDGYLAGRSTSFDDVESTAWYADVEGPVLVAVSGFDSASGQYVLTTDVTCPDYEDVPTCTTDDWFEDNDADDLPTPLNETYTFVDAAMCDDVDRYWAVIPAGCMYQAITTDVGALDVDLDLFDLGDDVVLVESYTDNDVEAVSWIADEPMVGEIAVWPYSGTGAYTLETVLACPDPGPLTCPDDDIFEDNETASVPLNPITTFLEAIACEDDTDFYAAWVPAGCTLSADLVQDDVGDVDLYLWQGATIVDDSENDPPDDEAASWTPSTSRWIDVEVFPFAGGTTYLLETKVTCPAPPG